MQNAKQSLIFVLKCFISVASVSNQDVFLYHWIDMDAYILGSNFLEQGLQRL